MVGSGGAQGGTVIVSGGGVVAGPDVVPVGPGSCGPSQTITVGGDGQLNAQDPDMPCAAGGMGYGLPGPGGVPIGGPGMIIGVPGLPGGPRPWRARPRDPRAP